MNLRFALAISVLSLSLTGSAYSQKMTDPITICLKPEMKKNRFGLPARQNVNRGDKVKGFLYQTKRTDVDCSIAQQPGSNVETANILMKIHGQTSQTYAQKSYNIEFVDKDFNSLDKKDQINFAGLPKGEKFTFTSNYVDRANMRNAFAFTMASELGQTRLDAKGKPDTFGTPFVYGEVSFNKDYNGLYMISARAERAKERIDIKKVDEDNYQNFDWIGEICTGVADADFHSKRKTTIKYHYPESDNLARFKDPEKTRLALKSMTDQIEKLEDVLSSPNFADPRTGYAAYIDVPSFIDFILLEELAKNVDGLRRSAWFRVIDGKFRMGPVWDFDISFGNFSLYNMFLTSGWLLDFGQGTWFSPGGIEQNPAAFWFKRLLEDPAFANQLRARYTELRRPGAPFHDDHVAELVERLRSTIGPAGERQQARWKGTYFNPLSSVVFHAPPFLNGYEKNVELLSTWLIKRLDWMDKNISRIEKRGSVLL